MPPFEKPSPEFVAFYREIMLDFPQTTLRMTFGCLCAYFNGHMLNGVYVNQMFVRLNPADERELLAVPGAASFAPMQNRPMKGYVVLPETILASSEQLNTWITRSLEFVSSLPPKEKKRVKKR
jgi:TfoX/Sxy family transcriptional regulator of competence genes